jgi:hypothetical protein|tara:strand:- start:5882 stop:6193 length:312 start_codon:yes stop_codon:yes gene_type:complete
VRVESSVSALQSPLNDKAVKRNKQQDNAQQDVASALGGAKDVQEIIRSGSVDAFDQAETFRQQAGADDSSTFSSQNAIDTYQSVSKEERRNEIQQMLGVDTFA